MHADPAAPMSGLLTAALFFPRRFSGGLLAIMGIDSDGCRPALRRGAADAFGRLVQRVEVTALSDN